MWVAFANAKATHIFSAKISVYMPYLMINFNVTLTNDIVSFEQLGPDHILAATWIIPSDTCAERRLKSSSASAQSDQSPLSALRNIASLSFQSSHSKDYDQTEQMRCLISIFAQRTCPKFVFSWCGSNQWAGELMPVYRIRPKSQIIIFVACLQYQTQVNQQDS